MLDCVVGRELLRVQSLADLCGIRISDAPLEVAKPNSLFDFHTVANGAAPSDDRSRIVPGRGRFAIPRLDPGVARRGACVEIKFWTPHAIDATSSP